MTALLLAEPLPPELLTPAPDRPALSEPAPDRPALAHPAARRISVSVAPRREPPFDDEIDAATAPGRRPAPILRIVQPRLPFTGPRGGEYGAYERDSAAIPAATDALPDPARWSRRLLIALLEARAGLRPVRQLAGHLSPAVQSGLAAEFARSGGPQAARSTVRSVHVFEPADGVAEVAAVVQSAGRYRAIAARLEASDGRWRCVRLQFG